MKLRKKDKQLLLTASAVLAPILLLAAGSGRAKGLSYLGRTDLPRGMKNNNPGNIRISNTPWQGKIPAGRNTDGAFEQFENYMYGIRAMIKLIRDEYIIKRNLRTIRQILNRYAPPVENATNAYINFVASKSGFSADQQLGTDKNTLQRIILPMAYHENGREAITPSQFSEAWGASLSGIGAIVETMPPGITPCLDGKYSTIPHGPGVCSYHGGSWATKAQKAAKKVSQSHVKQVPQANYFFDAERSKVFAGEYVILGNDPSTYIALMQVENIQPDGVKLKKLEILQNGMHTTAPVSPYKIISLKRLKSENFLKVPTLEEGKHLMQQYYNQVKKKPHNTLKELDFSTLEKDIPYQVAFDAHRGTSFSPDVRAKQVIQDYISTLAEAYQKFKESVKYNDISEVNAAFERYRAGYKKRYLDWLHAKSRVLSMMITGGSNFPTSRNQKNLNIEDARFKELIEYEEKYLPGINRKKQVIRTGELDAMQKLQEKLSSLERAQTTMVQANKIIRSNKDITARLIELGFTQKQAEELQQPDYMGRKGFASYALTNNSSEIRRIKERIVKEEMLAEQRKSAAIDTAEATEFLFEGGRVLKNFNLNRLQILFDSIPSAEMRSKLKARGFRWSPSEKAWQRQLTNDARFAASNILNVQISSIGAIYPHQPKSFSLYPCNDGTYSTTGACNWHGGRSDKKPITYQVIKKGKLPPLAKSGIVQVPIHTINIAHEWFQNRAAPYSERSVANIIEAVKSGTFRWVNLDPVTLWVDSAGKVFVLSGHSRLEAFNRLCKMQLKAEGRGFCAIPAKITQVSLEEAKKIALESNTLSTKETDLERAQYYRKLRTNEGKGLTELREIAKRLEGNNAAKIIAFSYLNPAGKTYNALVALDSGDLTSRGNIQNIARWIGNARISYPALTNRHENELYDWLVDMRGYGTSKGQISNEIEFKNRLEALIAKRTQFGILNESLNVQSAIYRSPIEMKYDKQIIEAKDLLTSIEKQLKDKVTELARRGMPESKIKEVTAGLEASLLRARVNLQNLLLAKGKVQEAAKRELSLFGIKGIKRPCLGAC